MSKKMYLRYDPNPYPTDCEADSLDTSRRNGWKNNSNVTFCSPINMYGFVLIMEHTSQHVQKCALSPDVSINIMN